MISHWVPAQTVSSLGWFHLKSLKSDFTFVGTELWIVIGRSETVSIRLGPRELAGSE